MKINRQEETEFYINKGLGVTIHQRRWPDDDALITIDVIHIDDVIKELDKLKNQILNSSRYKKSIS